VLHHLIEYAERHGLGAEPGFSPKNVRWAIACDATGHFTEVIPLGDDKSGRLFACCADLTQPELVGGKEPRCHFLVETAQIVALHKKDNEDAAEVKKAEQKHAFFVQLLRAASEDIPELDSAARMLDDPQELARIRDRLKVQKAKPTDKVTLYIGDAFPVETATWHPWWRRFKAGMGTLAQKGTAVGTKESSQRQMVCFVTGESVVPVMTHEKIRGLALVGGLALGDALVCFDKDAFTSYGLEQSANAAMSEAAAKAYREALNRLIREHSRPLAGARVVHWFKDRISDEDDALSWLSEPPEQTERSAQRMAKELLEAIAAGRRPDLARNRYFALALSGAAGRVMVRDWMEGAFEDLVRNVHAWFEDLSVTRLLSHSVTALPPIERVITCLLVSRKPSQKYSDWVKPIGPARKALLGSAVTGGPIPAQLIPRLSLQVNTFFQSGELEAALEKDRNLGLVLALLYARIGVIKAFHIRKPKGGVPMSPYLNEDHPDPAYHCGRLLAVLAGLQRSALGDVGAGVVQRYYTATCQAPALMVGRLVANAKNHLNKLEPGLAWWYESEIAGVMGRIGDRPPRTLDLERQSLFALGYYQQLAHNRAGKGGGEARKEEGANV
jgi:CRISPR-associated protein Csd1